MITRWIRLVPLGMALVLTQIAILPNVRVFGIVPDLALLAAISVAWTHGGEIGAWFGFATGLVLDLFVSTPFAMTALAYGVTAYIAAELHTLIDRRVTILLVASGLGAGLISGVIFVVASILVGADNLQHPHTIVVVLVAALYDGALAVPVNALVRFVLGDDGGARV